MASQFNNQFNNQVIGQNIARDNPVPAAEPTLDGDLDLLRQLLGGAHEQLTALEAKLRPVVDPRFYDNKPEQSPKETSGAHPVQRPRPPALELTDSLAFGLRLLCDRLNALKNHAAL